MATEIWVNIGSGNGLLHQAITWTNVDLSSVMSSDIHLKGKFARDTSAINHQHNL